MRINSQASAKQIEEAARRCRRIVHLHAAASAGAAVIPLPWVSVAVDAATLRSLAVQVLRQFGLARDQIDALAIDRRAAVLRALRQQGCRLVGKNLTKRAVIGIAARYGRRLLAKRLVRYVPAVGTAISATMSYAVILAVGHMLVAECERVRQALSGR